MAKQLGRPKTHGSKHNLGNIRLWALVQKRLDMLIAETGMKKSDIINYLILDADVDELKAQKRLGDFVDSMQHDED